jgi:hypothetical protein
MLARVQYPGPDGGVRSFDAEVPDDTSSPYTFTHKADGTPLDVPIEAKLVRVDRSWQPDGDVAFYRAEMPSDVSV